MTWKIALGVFGALIVFLFVTFFAKFFRYLVLERKWMRFLRAIPSPEVQMFAAAIYSTLCEQAKAQISLETDTSARAKLRKEFSLTKITQREFLSALRALPEDIKYYNIRRVFYKIWSSSLVNCNSVMLNEILVGAWENRIPIPKKRLTQSNPSKRKKPQKPATTNVIHLSKRPLVKSNSTEVL